MTCLRHVQMNETMRKHVYRDVIARLHAAIARMQANQLMSSYDGWPSMAAMQTNLATLKECLNALLQGEPLETTQRSQLFAMRELALASVPNILMDGVYVMPGKNLVLNVGPLTMNIRRSHYGIDVIVMDSPDESKTSKTHFAFPKEEGEFIQERRLHAVA